MGISDVPIIKFLSSMYMFMNKRTFYSIIYRFKKIMPTVLICIEIELKFM